MAMTKKALNDHFIASFGQESETAPPSKDGLIVGGVYQTTPPTIGNGEFSRLQTDAYGNLMVNILAGEVIASLGTVNIVEEVSNLAGGTTQIDPKPTKDILNYGTTIAGTAEAELIAAPGAGTSIYLNSLDIVNSGTALLEVSVGYGTAVDEGASRVANGVFGLNGGISKSYPVPTNAGLANHALKGIIGAAGTASIQVTYWIE